MATGFVWHELFMWHDTQNYAGVFPPGLTLQPGQHHENPDSKRRFKNLMDVAGLTAQLVSIAPREASRAELERVHNPAYLDQLAALSAERGGDAGVLTPFGHGGYDIAKLSAGGALALVEAVVTGQVQNGYALVRPPGHHCLPNQGMGFCLLANAAIAAHHAMAVHGLQRIAIVDWDVHHGNGTEAIFYDSASVLTISVHQDRCFPPDTGHLKDIGAGAGAGYNLNIPLPPGCGDGAYEAVFDRIIIPALDAYRPELIIVPSGFDAGAHDPLGRMMLHSESYRSLTAKLMAAAERHCDGRLAILHEGGYSPQTVPYFGLAVVEQLSGIRTGIDDPFLGLMAGLGQQELQPYQEPAIAAAEVLLDHLR